MFTKFKTPKGSRAWLRPVLIALVIALAGVLAAVLVLRHASQPATRSTSAADTKQISALPDGRGPVHEDIMTSVFWVGEAADSENDYISNVPSAWEADWQAAYGGYDDPNDRKGYNPAKFTPHENPFYFALPYGDLTENGARKDTSHGCLPYTANTDDKYSWCKNVWIAVVYNGKTAYAQWEDVGPNEHDDADYVFGTAKPQNTFGVKAGLDVSPAVRDYLGLDGADKTSWSFVPAAQVPDGPWKTIVTTSRGYSLY